MLVRSPEHLNIKLARTGKMSKFNQIYFEAIGDPSLNAADINALKVPSPQADAAKKAIRHLTDSPNDASTIISKMIDPKEPLNYDKLSPEQKKIVDDALKVAKITPAKDNNINQPQQQKTQQAPQQKTASEQQPASYTTSTDVTRELQGVGAK